MVVASAGPPSKPVRIDTLEGEGDDAEESDEYDVADEDGEEDEADESGDDDDDEGEGEEGGGLTALLLGSHGVDEEYEDKGWVPDGGREPADFSGDEDEDEDTQAPEGAKIPTPKKPTSKSAVTLPTKEVTTPTGVGKKRARDEDPEGHNEKKLKKF